MSQPSATAAADASVGAMVEYVVVGGGIAGVSALEELVRVLADEADDGADGLRPIRVTLLHPSSSLVRIAAAVRHTDALEEVTALGALDAQTLLEQLQSNIPPEARSRLLVRMQRGTLVGLEPQSKQLLYRIEEADASSSSSAVAIAPASSPTPIHRLRYDKLCLCTGARPALFLQAPAGSVLPPQVVVVRDAASLTRLSELLAAPTPVGPTGANHCQRAKRVAIVGNGGIALELVHALQTSQLATINTSDTVAAASAIAAGGDSPAASTSSASTSTSVASLPPLHVDWIVPHAFMGSTFLDHMASAFLMPELFPETDPALPASAMSAAATTSADANMTDGTEHKAATAEAAPTNEEAEEKIVSVKHGKHVRTILRDPSGVLASSASAAAAAAASSSAAAPASSSVATSAASSVAPAGLSAPVGAALGPNWLNQLFTDTNIPKYVLERERALKAAALAAAAAGSKQPTVPALRPFDLSLELCSEVAEVEVLPPGSNAEGYPLSLLLTSGKRSCCDLVVSAVGVVPNTDWAVGSAGAGLALALAEDGGILIDESMRTSLPGVFAAGDCATLRFSPSFLAQHDEFRAPCLFQQARLWSHAKLLGCYAARALSGRFDAELAELGGFNFLLFAHSTTLFGLKVILLGRYNLQGFSVEDVRRLKASGQLRTLVRCKPEGREEFIKLHLLAGRLIGAVLIGPPTSDSMDLEETFENLMNNQTNLEQFGDFLNDVQIDIADYFD